MTKPTLARITPTEADIATLGNSLPNDGDRRYAFATGYLGSLIETLATNHRGCRRRNCATCCHLRQGLALVAAVDRANLTQLGGGR